MSMLLLQSLTPDERAKLREVEAKRIRDEREQRIAEQVSRIEQEVKALRALLRGQEGRRDAR
jgi:hypothetical protein